MAIVSRKSGGALTPKQQIIRINPYEIPENVLYLMSQISSSRPSADSNLFWEPIYDMVYSETDSLYEFIEENRSNFSNIDFGNHLHKKCISLSIELQTRENTTHTQIVVAGGFSSGKSSFLNKLVGDGNLLPTGVDPVSVVPTYLYCSDKQQEVSVKGVNSKNAVIALSREVLQAIQHSKKSNIHIASVIDKLFVEVNAPKVKGIVFIDTPGYNNSNKKNDSNDKTDEETAIESLKEGQALIWLIDCEKGNTVTDDLNIINKFEGPKLIIFHKADKKGDADSKKIVRENGTLLSEKYGDDLIDVIAYSSRDEKLYASYKNYTSLDALFDAIKNKLGAGNSGRNEIISEIEALFADEIRTSNALKDELEAERKEAIKSKSEASKNQNETDNIYANWKENIKAVAQSYVDVDEAREIWKAISKDAIEEFLEFFNGVVYFDKNDHWGNSSILDNAISNARRNHEKLRARFNKEIKKNYDVYKHEYINGEFVNILVEDADRLREQEGKDRVDYAEERCQQICEQINTEQDFANALTKYKTEFLKAIKKGIFNYEKGIKTDKIQKNECIDKFLAVKQGNLAELVSALSKDAIEDDAKRPKDQKKNGYDMSKCNQDGYSILTYAVSLGKIEIVKFLLEHDADPATNDRRGYNAFLTAVECQNQSMCELLLAYDSDLVDTTTSSGETAEDLLQKQTFSKWILNKL